MDRTRIVAAYEKVQRALLAERSEDGHWIGHLASSALSTATSVSALAVFRETVLDNQTDSVKKIESLIHGGCRWILAHQNADGGWGDTKESPSNPSTTLLAKCALILAENCRIDNNEKNETKTAIARADEHLHNCGGIDAVVKRYGNDRTFSVPILTNSALADLVPWSEVPSLPFEFASVPQSFFRLLNMQVVSYAIPALVAIGQLIEEKKPSKNAFLRKVRNWMRQRTLQKVLRMQPKSGGFLEAAPLTAFVVMSLSASKHFSGNTNTNATAQKIVENGLQFLFDSVRDDGSWPVDTNLANWTTTLSVNALSVNVLANSPDSQHELLNAKELEQLWDWILSNQHKEKHPFTGATPGGWAWTDLSGGVPDVDDTAGTLLALCNLEIWGNQKESIEQRTGEEISKQGRQIRLGIRWLLSLQNSDGGWPTFCKGWNRFPFDRSSVDLTAHTIRALTAWITVVGVERKKSSALYLLVPQMHKAVEKGMRFLFHSQQKDGSWLPLWFGNQYHAREENPLYGTTKVLLALDALEQYLDLYDGNLPDSPEYQQSLFRAFRFLISAANPDGGFGCSQLQEYSEQDSVQKIEYEHYPPNSRSSVEETALVIDAIAPFANRNIFLHELPELAEVQQRAIAWLVEQIENEPNLQASPIGLYFTKLWYDEKLYPYIYSTAALGNVLKNL